MKIVLSENKMLKLITNVIIEGNSFDGNSNHNPYQRKIDSDNVALERLLKLNGVVLTNIENGSDYITYEITSFANLIGKRYCLCRLLKNGEQYGSMYIKPLNIFKIKNY